MSAHLLFFFLSITIFSWFERANWLGASRRTNEGTEERNWKYNNRVVFFLAFVSFFPLVPPPHEGSLSPSHRIDLMHFRMIQEPAQIGWGTQRAHADDWGFSVISDSPTTCRKWCHKVYCCWCCVPRVHQVPNASQPLSFMRMKFTHFMHI